MEEILEVTVFVQFVIVETQKAGNSKTLSAADVLQCHFTCECAYLFMLCLQQQNLQHFFHMHFKSKQTALKSLWGDIVAENRKVINLREKAS